MTIELTIHGEERTKQRLGAKGKSQVEQAERAWRKGKTLEDYTGKPRKYLENLFSRSSGEHIRIFGGHVFLFGNEGVGKVVLITTIPLNPRAMGQR